MLSMPSFSSTNMKCRTVYLRSNVQMEGFFFALLYMLICLDCFVLLEPLLMCYFDTGRIGHLSRLLISI